MLCPFCQFFSNKMHGFFPAKRGNPYYVKGHFYPWLPSLYTYIYSHFKFLVITVQILVELMITIIIFQ